MKRNKNQGWFKLLAVFHIIVLSFLILLWGQSRAEQRARTLTFRKGDAIRLTIWQPLRIGEGKNHSLDINGDYPIDSRGHVFLPLVGDVKVVGHNTETLANLLKEKFSPYYQDPVIIVNPLIRVTMQGAFNRPGTYLVKPDASLWELVDLAGGPSDRSNLQKMWVERGGKIINGNLLGSFEKGYSLREIGIVSGDQILVPQRGHFTLRDAFDILRFGVTILNLYIVIQRI
ncbi:MAG: polysaccharide biosynthesis/export family protein [bacterium]